MGRLALRFTLPRFENMAGLELLSDQGYRIDGRKASELRKIQARMGVFAQADGSAYLEQGNTKVLAVVYGPHEVSSKGGWSEPIDVV